jgi:ATP-dependent Lon protease
LHFRWIRRYRQSAPTATDEALHRIVRDYTREAGVRPLERQIGAVCRKVAVQIAEAHAIPSIAMGLAVTAVGGDILFEVAT